MEWLLILSALLNAATGAFTGTRGADAAAPHEAAVEAVAVAETVTSGVVSLLRAIRPSASAPGVPLTPFAPAVDLVLAAAPIDTDRLIE